MPPPRPSNTHKDVLTNCRRSRLLLFRSWSPNLCIFMCIMSLAAVAKPTRVSLDAVNSEFRQLAETVALSGEDNAQVATVVENNSEVKPEAEMGQVAGTPLTVRVLTFNIWLSGRRVENGLEKIAKHIRQINPDIVSLQEVETPDVMNNITEMLGHPWNAVWHGNRSYPDTAILTKHKFMLDQIVEVNWGNGAPVLVVKHGRSFVVNFFAMHLNYPEILLFGANVLIFGHESIPPLNKMNITKFYTFENQNSKNSTASERL